MLLRISVFDSPELQGVILALGGMDKTLSAQIRKATKTVTVAEWRRFLAAEASTELERRTLVDTARVAVSNTNVSLRTGQLAKRTTGGAKTFELTPGVEFGDRVDVVEQRSRAGNRYKRRQGSTFKRQKRTGYVAYPAAATAIPRIASLWVATVVRTFHEAIEKGTG